MRVKVPRQIPLGAHTYKVVFRPNFLAIDKLTGQVNHHSQVIEIEPILAETEKAQVLMHEQLHIIDNQYSLSLSEADIDRIAEGITEFLLRGLGLEFDWSDIKGE